MPKLKTNVMVGGRSGTVDKVELWATSRSDATRFAEAARISPEIAQDYYEINWYLYRLDEVQRDAVAKGKHPAAVSALRTMAEIVGIVGPQVNTVDARTQILALPEGLSEEALIALATMAIDREKASE